MDDPNLEVVIHERSEGDQFKSHKSIGLISHQYGVINARSKID